MRYFPAETLSKLKNIGWIYVKWFSLSIWKLIKTISIPLWSKFCGNLTVSVASENWTKTRKCSNVCLVWQLFQRDRAAQLPRLTLQTTISEMYGEQSNKSNKPKRECECECLFIYLFIFVINQYQIRKHTHNIKQ